MPDLFSADVSTECWLTRHPFRRNQNEIIRGGLVSEIPADRQDEPFPTIRRPVRVPVFLRSLSTFYPAGFNALAGNSSAIRTGEADRMMVSEGGSRNSPADRCLGRDRTLPRRLGMSAKFVRRWGRSLACGFQSWRRSSLHRGTTEFETRRVPDRAVAREPASLQRSDVRSAANARDSTMPSSRRLRTPL